MLFIMALVDLYLNQKATFRCMRPVGEVSCYEAQALDRNGGFLPCPQCNLLSMMRELERKSRDLERIHQEQKLHTSTSNGSLSAFSGCGGRQPLIMGSLLEGSALQDGPSPALVSLSSSTPSAASVTASITVSASSVPRRQKSATRRSPLPAVHVSSSFKPSMVRAGYVLGLGPLSDDVLFRPIKKNRGFSSPSRSRSPSRSPSRAPSPKPVSSVMRPASPLTVSPFHAFDEETVSDRDRARLPVVAVRVRGLKSPNGKSAKAMGQEGNLRGAAAGSPASILSSGTMSMFSPGPSPLIHGRNVFVPIAGASNGTVPAGGPQSLLRAAGSADSPQSTVVAAYLAQAHGPSRVAAGVVGGSASFESFYTDTFPDPLADDMADLSLAASDVSAMTPPLASAVAASTGTFKRPKTPASATGSGRGRSSSASRVRALRSPSSRTSSPTRRPQSPATLSIDLYAKLKDQMSFTWGSLSDASVRRYNDKCTLQYAVRKTP